MLLPLNTNLSKMVRKSASGKKRVTEDEKWWQRNKGRRIEEKQKGRKIKEREEKKKMRSRKGWGKKRR